jgi:hypothetical protein
MPNLPFQLITITANIIVVMFVVYYLMRLQTREEKLEKKESKLDTEYNKLVENALAKEEKLLKEAKNHAQQIITGAETVRSASQEPVEETLQKMLDSIQKDAHTTAHDVRDKYAEALKEISKTSLKDFERMGLDLKKDLEEQIKTLHQNLLPNMEKEIDEYKKARLKEAEKTINQVVQKVSQEILNKSLSAGDHQKILLASMEKAKMEGLFN